MKWFGMKMLAVRFVLVMLAFAWLIAPRSGSAAPPAASPKAAVPPSTVPPSAEQIQTWLSALSAREFETRDEATEALVRAGRTAIAPVLAFTRRRDPEVATRALMVLKGIGERGDLDTLEASIDALGTAALGTAGITALSRPALLARSRLEAIRQDRAVEYFQSRGALVEPRAVDRSLVVESLFAVEIGPGWKGTRQDLDRLKWIYDAEQVSFVGPQVVDDWLLPLRQMPNVFSVKVKRGSITAKGIEELAKLPRMRILRLLYLDLGDEAVPPLLACDGLSRLVLVSPRLSEQGVTRLKDQFKDRVDCPRGALLGVQAQSEEPWSVREVVRGSAAEKAGLLVDDRIVKFNDTPVATFAELKQLIGKCNAGDTADIDVERGDRVLKLKITFGEWD